MRTTPTKSTLHLRKNLQPLHNVDQQLLYPVLSVDSFLVTKSLCNKYATHLLVASQILPGAVTVLY